MKQIFNWKAGLIVIVLLASFLRLWQLGEIPSGIHADEADTGYSAYSILKTGKTQYADFNPLMFTEENGGSHPPVYTYILIPIIYFGGLNIVVERMPSVIAGLGLVIVFYFLLRKIFKDQCIALLGTFLLAINPWAIEASRQGLLESVALFLMVSGITVFLYAKKTYVYVFSAILLGLSLHAYDTPKIILPLILLSLIIYKWKTFKKKKSILIAVLITFSIFYALMVYVLFAGQIKDYASVSILNQQQVSKEVDRERFLTNAPLWLSSIFHNKLTVFTYQVSANYSKIFTFNWLYINGPEGFESTTHGEYYLFELPLLFLGIYFIIKSNKKLATLLLFWMVIAPIPAAVTYTGNFPLRAIFLLPIPIIFSSYGLIRLWNYLNKNNLFNIAVKSTIVIFMIFFVFRFFVIYFFDYPVFASEYWAKQQNDALRFAIEQSNKYKSIFIDGGNDWLMMYGFFTNENPSDFQRAYKNKIYYKGVEVVKIKNLYFGSFSNVDKTTFSSYFPKDSLVITNGDKFKTIKPDKQFFGPDKLRVVFKAFVVR